MFSSYIYSININIILKTIGMRFYFFQKNNIYAQDISMILGHIYNIDIFMITNTIKIHLYFF